MFCKYCGKPIDEGTMRCKICGRPVGPLEGGNGFWDLTGTEEEPAAPAPASPEDAAALRALREKVNGLRKDLDALPAQKKSALPVIAALLGLLALALGVFVLFRMQLFSVRLQAAEQELAELRADNTAFRQQLDAALNPNAAEGQEENAEGESKWKGLRELTGLRLQASPNLFEGPNKGPNDPRGQSIRLGYPENGYEETPIFTARFLGPPGTYRYYWVKVENDEQTGETFFTPLLEEEGFFFRNPNASDTDKTYILSIMGEVKQEQLGRYAFVVEDTQTRSAYVSGVVELYDRAEQTAPDAGQGE